MAVSIVQPDEAQPRELPREIIPGWDTTKDPLPERLDVDLLLRAYRFSEEAHRGQKRKSGED